MSKESMAIVELKLQKLKLLEKESSRRELLPHLYGLKLYPWMRAYVNAKFNKRRYVCAANQIGKSSSQIRDRITIATTPSLWPKLWPKQFELSHITKPFSWYLYPNFDTVSGEVYDKWIPQFLPRGKMRTDPVFGWNLNVENKKIKSIVFNSGYKIYFKTYSQNVIDLQSGTPFAIDCFTKGHKVYCLDGVKNIEEILVGDYVLTRKGFKKVYRTMCRTKNVITRATKATSITGTPDHPFILHDEVKSFASLERSDILLTIPLRRLVWALFQTKKLSYLKEIFTTAFRKVITLGKETISPEVKTERSMLQYGLATIKERMQGEYTAQDYAQTSQKVYNISVEDNHEYYINGILVHNCDEELPMSLKSELDARLYSSDGYFSMVFTATIGQDYWKDVTEGKGREERDKGAFKIQVSMYDCLKYEDGTSTPWTEEKIQRIKESCRNKSEVERRVYGKFVVDIGLVYPTFERPRHFIQVNDNMKNRNILPKDWMVYTGVDIGTGGENNHPAAMVILGCSPNYKKIRVMKCKRMDKIETTASDILNAYQHLIGSWKPVIQSYDWAARDFYTIASRCGIPFSPAKKNHDQGEMVLNTLFKMDILKIYDTSQCSLKLVRELESFRIGENKRNSKDDLIDALRYAIMAVPLDWDAVINANHKSLKHILPGALRGKEGSVERERTEDYEKEQYFKRVLGKEAEEDIRYWANEFDEY